MATLVTGTAGPSNNLHTTHALSTHHTFLGALVYLAPSLHTTRDRYPLFQYICVCVGVCERRRNLNYSRLDAHVMEKEINLFVQYLSVCMCSELRSALRLLLHDSD